MRAVLTLIAILSMPFLSGCEGNNYDELNSTELALIGHWAARSVTLDSGETTTVAKMGMNEQWLFFSDKTFEGYMAASGDDIQIETGTWSADYVSLYINTGARTNSYMIKGSGDKFGIYVGGTNAGWINYFR